MLNVGNCRTYCVILSFTDTTFYTDWRFVAVLLHTRLLAPFFQQHLFPLCVSHFVVIQQYLNIFHCYFYGGLWSVIFDVMIAKRLQFTEDSWYFLAIKYFLIKRYMIFNIMLLHTLNRLQYVVKVTFIFIGKQKIDVVHFIAIIALVQWSGTKPIMSPRYCL